MAATDRTAGNQLGGLLLAVATAAGVFLGLGGPATSPVAPGARPVPVLQGLVNRIGDLPADQDGPGQGRR